MTVSRPARPRRVYTSVAVEPVTGGFALLLDGQRARTPAGGSLRAPTRALAARLAGEWEGQEERVEFDRMPLTRLAFTALDRTVGCEAAVASEVLRFLANDLLCYRAEGPERLVRRQSETFDPLLDWVSQTHGVSLEVVSGVMPSRRPPGGLDALAERFGRLDAFRLTGLAYGSALLGSAVLALALAHGRLTGTAAIEASQLDEIWQAEIWGRDPEAESRAEGARREALALEAWFQDLRPDP